jgi:hypothetical protein
MREAILPLPNTSSWRDASLSTGTTLSLPFLEGSCHGLFEDNTQTLPGGTKQNYEKCQPRNNWPCFVLTFTVRLYVT